MSIRKGKSRKNRKSSPRTQMRKPVSVRKFSVIDDAGDKIMIDILKAKDNKTLKKIYFDIDSKIFHMENTGTYSKEEVESLISDTYTKVYQTSDAKLGSLIREYSKKKDKYKTQIKGLTDVQIGKIARSQIDGKIRRRKKYMFDSMSRSALGKKFSKWYHDIWVVGDVDKKRNKNTNEKGTFDWWTVRHFIGGFLIGLAIPYRRVEFFAGGVAFETGEEWLSRQQPDYSGAHEKLSNKGVDLVANQLGYELGSFTRTAVSD